MGRHQDAWRAAQARHPSRSVDSFDLHGAAAGPAVADLEDLHPQSCRGPRVDRSVRGADDCVSAAFCMSCSGPQTPAVVVVCGDPQSDGGMVDAPDHRGVSVGYLVRDNDRAFGAAFKARVRVMGIRDRPTSFRSPWQNSHVERLIGSTRHECTNHLIVFNEEHLRRILSKYASYYNEVRTHLSLGKDAPCTRPIERFGDIIAQPILGGLHHRYARI